MFIALPSDSLNSLFASERRLLCRIIRRHWLFRLWYNIKQKDLNVGSQTMIFTRSQTRAWEYGVKLESGLTTVLNSAKLCKNVACVKARVTVGGCSGNNRRTATQCPGYYFLINALSILPFSFMTRFIVTKWLKLLCIRCQSSSSKTASTCHCDIYQPKTYFISVSQ